MIFFYIIIFIISSIFLSLSGKWLVDSLSKIAKFLGWKEFVVAFATVAFGVSLPNLFVGIISAIKKIPILSFGDVIGGNIIDLTLAMGIAALISRGGLSASSRTVQGSTFFTFFIAILPLILILDRVFSRVDGILLLFVFFAYIFWLFSKKDRFVKIYNEISQPLTFKYFLREIILFLIALAILLIAANGVVESAYFFANILQLSIATIGVIIVALGNALPETIFSVEAARKGQDWLILGDLMGGVIITSTLVLGIVCLICPFEIDNLSTILTARIFLILSSLFFFFTIKTDKKITKNEAFFLLSLYILFLLVEIFIK